MLPDDPERLVTIVFTSGTTGMPKGAMFGERELAAVASIDTGGAWAEPGTAGGAMLSGTQLAHIGFMTKLPWYLQRAMTLHLIDRWRAADVLRMIADERMASIGGVAPQLALLLRQPDFDDHDLSAVKTIVMGGALSPPALVREARARIGAAYSIRYSSTESGGVGTATAFDADDDEALFTVGRPRAGIELEIRDEDDAPARARARSARSASAPPPSSAATGGTPTPPRPRSATVGCTAATSGSSTRRAACAWPGGPRRCTSAAATTSTRSRSRRCWPRTPTWPRSSITPRPDPVMGEIGVAVVVARDPSEPPTLDELRAYGGETAVGPQAARGPAPGRRAAAHPDAEDRPQGARRPRGETRSEAEPTREAERHGLPSTTRRRSSPDGLLPERRPLVSSRLEAFSDGVLAIAITLLILEVRVPDAEPGGLAVGPRPPVAELRGLRADVRHHRDHVGEPPRAVRRRSRSSPARLMFLNLFLLMTIAFLPFPTALMAEYLREGDNSHIATAVYGANMTLIGVGFLVIWFYLCRQPDLMVDGLDADDARQSMRRTLPGPIIYGATIGLAYVWAPACLIVYAAHGRLLHALAAQPGRRDRGPSTPWARPAIDQPSGRRRRRRGARPPRRRPGRCRPARPTARPTSSR